MGIVKLYLPIKYENVKTISLQSLGGPLRVILIF